MFFSDAGISLDIRQPGDLIDRKPFGDIFIRRDHGEEGISLSHLNILPGVHGVAA